MPFKLNPLTGQLDLVGSAATGSVTGIPPTTPGSIARWVDTGGTTIQNSPNTNVQDGGAIESSGFIMQNHMTTTVEVKSGETMVVASYLDLDTGATLIIDGDGELVII